MKMKVIVMLAAFALTASAAAAQELPRKVQNVEVLDLDGKPAKLPHFGEKNLMIFYVDPDRHKQNEDFTIELEKNGRASGENIYGFGVMNLKDAPMVPNGRPTASQTHGLERRHGAGRSGPHPEQGLGAGRLQQPVRADDRIEGGRTGVRAQGHPLRRGQGGFLPDRREVQIDLDGAPIVVLILVLSGSLLTGRAQEGTRVADGDTLHYTYTPPPRLPERNLSCAA